VYSSRPNTTNDILWLIAVWLVTKLARVEITYARYVRPLRVGLIPFTYDLFPFWHLYMSRGCRSTLSLPPLVRTMTGSAR
jgi:hypothetical protein